MTSSHQQALCIDRHLRSMGRGTAPAALANSNLTLQPAFLFSYIPSKLERNTNGWEISDKGCMKISTLFPPKMYICIGTYVVPVIITKSNNLFYEQVSRYLVFI